MIKKLNKSFGTFGGFNGGVLVDKLNEIIDEINKLKKKNKEPGRPLIKIKFNANDFEDVDKDEA